MADRLDARGPIDSASQLQKVGFERLGTSPLYRAGEFIASVRPNGTYQFYSDYPAPYEDRNLAGLRGIRKGIFSYSTTPCLVFVGIDQHQRVYSAEMTTNGSGGP